MRGRKSECRSIVNPLALALDVGVEQELVRIGRNVFFFTLLFTEEQEAFFLVRNTAKPGFVDADLEALPPNIADKPELVHRLPEDRVRKGVLLHRFADAFPLFIEFVASSVGEPLVTFARF